MPKRATAGKKDWLLFVDTNILLNFYRLRDDTSLQLLRRLERLKKQLITTFQVEIEFKKNRLHEIRESIKSLKSSATPIPPFLAEAQGADNIRRALGNIGRGIKKLNQHTQIILANPSKDRVFKMVERLFNTNGPYSLQEQHPELDSIRRDAWQRFTLGWPPRKSADTSMGDAINWEWILWCVRKSGKNVIVVTQDGDYGIRIGPSTYPNDRLVDEVRKVDRQRKIVVFDRLAAALKEMQVRVTKREEQEEEQSLSAIPALPAPQPTSLYNSLRPSTITVADLVATNPYPNLFNTSGLTATPNVGLFRSVYPPSNDG